MRPEDTFPDLIAVRAQSAVDSLSHEGGSAAAATDHVRRGVLQAFGCICPPVADGHTSISATCPVHGTPPRVDASERGLMRSQVVSWETDPYGDYTIDEKREDVQESLRVAVEFARTFRSDLAGALRRGQAAQERLQQAIDHAALNGGLTHEEFDTAQTALLAMQHTLRLLYSASNHVGEPPNTQRDH